MCEKGHLVGHGVAIDEKTHAVVWTKDGGVVEETLSTNVAGPAVPLGARMPRKRPGVIQPGLVNLATLTPQKRKRTRVRAGVVRTEMLAPGTGVVLEGVGWAVAKMAGKAAGRGAAALGKMAGRGLANAVKKGHDKLSDAQRKKIASLGGKAAAKLRKGKKSVKKSVKKGARIAGQLARKPDKALVRGLKKSEFLKNTGGHAAARGVAKGAKGLVNGVKAGIKGFKEARRVIRNVRLDDKLSKLGERAKAAGHDDVHAAVKAMQGAMKRNNPAAFNKAHAQLKKAAAAMGQKKGKKR